METLLHNEVLLYAAFTLFVLGMLALDLGVFHRREHVISVRESLIWTAVWIVLAFLFAWFIYYRYETLAAGTGTTAALQFIAGYVIEKSLSIDNIFVFLLLFNYFQVPPIYQHRVLLWGILGALLFRAIFIGLGALLIAKFHFILYIFGIFLVFSGIKMALAKDKEIHPERNPVLRLLGRLMPITKDYDGNKFFSRQGARRAATPLFVVLLLVETTDIIFAVDSIPAIFAVTQDPFIVYTANVFAILGLRALYFALAGIMRLFHHLHFGLSAVLVFVGIKMLVVDLIKVPIGVSLGVIAGLIGLSVVASIIWPKKTETPPPTAADSIGELGR